MELIEIVKLATVVKEKNTFSLVSSWKPLLDFVLETKKNSDFGFCLLDVCCYING